MIPASDTAYPRFKQQYLPAELTRCYTPTNEDLALCLRSTKSASTRLGFMVLLKTFQHLGYFVRSEEVPEAIVLHIADALGEQAAVTKLRRYDALRARADHIRAIRIHLQVNPYSQDGEAVLQRALREAALSKEDLADIINVGLETLVRFRYELPAFSTILREARHQRASVYREIFTALHEQLGELGRQFFDQLLVTDPSRRLSPWHDLKQETPKPTIKVVYALLKRYQEVTDLTRYNSLLHSVPLIKIKQLAIEARSLDVTSLADTEPLKRYALMLALIRSQRARLADDLGDVFIKQIGRIKYKAEAELKQYLQQNQAKMDDIARRYAEFDDILDSEQAETDQLSTIRELIKSRPDLTEYARTHSEYGGKHAERFMWRYFKKRRAALLNILDTLQFISTSQDDSIIQALRFILAHRRAKAKWLPTLGRQRQGQESVFLDDLSWIPDAWWKLVTGSNHRDRFPEQIDRRQFEICFCVQLVRELKSADVCIVSSDAYSDYRQELLPLIECKETLTEYGEQVGLPTVSNDFIGHVKQLLAQAAQHTDASYPSNDHFQITDGEPHLRKLTRKPSPQDSEMLDKALTQHLDRLDLTLIDVLTETMKWLNWGWFFGPLSGHQRKITEEAKRYILTVFAYGTGLGPAQAARAIPDITARQIAFLNQRHDQQSRIVQ